MPPDISHHLAVEHSNALYTMMSFSDSIKGGTYSYSRHFLLVSLCASIMEHSKHISPGKGAFPSVASTSIAEAVLLLCYLNQFDLDLLLNSPCTTTTPFSVQESFLVKFYSVQLFASDEAVLIVFIQQEESSCYSCWHHICEQSNYFNLSQNESRCPLHM